nr:unnamed protein product [Callosobruchus analis]
MVGPNIQGDLLSIFIRFRQYKYVASADICKMHRQILVFPEQRSLQQVFWRPDPSQPVGAFQLNRVTYGTAPAAFLAVRTLHQLAEENQNALPKEAEIIRRDVYVDYLLTGTDSVTKLASSCKNVSDILIQDCFEVRKWVSNHPGALAQVQNLLPHIIYLQLGAHEQAKTLGLVWSSHDDTLLYKITIRPIPPHITKRRYDRLGLICPCTISAKVLMQKLWLAKLAWDDTVPHDIDDQWHKESFTEILHWADSTIVIRWVNTPSHLLKTFRHVCSSDNPADLVTRGASPSQLSKSSFWFHGPEWLSKDKSEWPCASVSIKELPELKAKIKETHIFPIERFSNLTRLKRCVAYCHRFISNAKVPKEQRMLTALTTKELDSALHSIMKQVQTSVPILLAPDDHLTIIIFKHFHVSLLHAGPQQLLAAIREKFWSKDDVFNFCANREIEWHFIPSHSPHFGGIWETGVKSMMYHLKRTLGNSCSVYEDFYTVLVQIEAVLNPRPLYPASSDPNDLDPITPSHFLIGRTITSPNDHDYADIEQSRLSRFQHL